MTQQQPPNKKKRYKVQVEMTFGLHKKKEYNVIQEQDKLDEMIGRFTRKYGPAINMSQSNGHFVLDFYSRPDGVATNVVLTFTTAEDSDEVTKPGDFTIVKSELPKELVTVPPPPPPKPENERVTKLLEANVLAKGF